MFTEFIQRLDQIEGLNASDKQLLKETLGACIAGLTHRGPVSIEVDGSQLGVPDRKYSNECNDPAGTFAALKLHNGYSQVSGDVVKNGYVLDACGVSRFTNDKGDISTVNKGILIQQKIVLGGDTIWDINNGWYDEYLPGDGKCKVNSGDTPDYLEDQFSNFVANASVPSTKELINFSSATDAGSPKMYAYWNYGAVSGYSGSGTLFFAVVNGTPTFIPASTSECASP